jgi:hypothetical protein
MLLWIMQQLPQFKRMTLIVVSNEVRVPAKADGVLLEKIKEYVVV